MCWLDFGVFVGISVGWHTCIGVDVFVRFDVGVSFGKSVGWCACVDVGVFVRFDVGVSVGVSVAWCAMLALMLAYHLVCLLIDV